MKVKIVTVLDNYGQERWIVKYTVKEMFWIFFTRTIWKHVECRNCEDPYFFEDYHEAKTRADRLLEGANPKKQRVVQILEEEEVVYD